MGELEVSEEMMHAVRSQDLMCQKLRIAIQVLELNVRPAVLHQING